jgi:hypothetical protein
MVSWSRRCFEGNQPGEMRDVPAAVFPDLQSPCGREATSSRILAGSLWSRIDYLVRWSANGMRDESCAVVNLKAHGPSEDGP